MLVCRCRRVKNILELKVVYQISCFVRFSVIIGFIRRELGIEFKYDCPLQCLDMSEIMVSWIDWQAKGLFRMKLMRTYRF